MILIPPDEVANAHVRANKFSKQLNNHNYMVRSSLLAQHNKLTSRLIFPGQKLRIPPEEKKEVKSEDAKKNEGSKGRKMEW